MVCIPYICIPYMVPYSIPMGGVDKNFGKMYDGFIQVSEEQGYVH